MTPDLPSRPSGALPALQGRRRGREVSYVAVPVPPAPGRAGGASDLHRYFEVLRTRWRLIAATAVTVLAAVATGTFLEKPMYRASGMIELRGQSGEGMPAEALFQAARLSNQFLGTQYGVLRSEALARRVLTSTGMLKRVPAESAATVQRRVERFTDRLVVDPVTGSNLVRVHYEAANPEVAARVVNAVFESYAEMRAEAGRTGVGRLRLEADSARQRLTLAERQLQAYARASGLTAVTVGGRTPEDLPHERLRILEQQLAEAEADRYAKQSLSGLARGPGDDMLESEILQALNVRLATLRSDYARLRSTFMDDYPKTRETREQMAEVESLLAAERGRLRSATAGRYAAAARNQELLQRAVVEQRALVDRHGELNTQYRIFARDVEAQRQLHATLQEKLRTAEVSAAAAAADVSVLEPAAVPTTPVRPVVETNLRLGLVAGLVLGVMLAFAREYADVTVRSADELETLSVPVLGAIPSVPAPGDGRAARWSSQIGSASRGRVRGPSVRPALAAAAPAPHMVRIDGPRPDPLRPGTLEDAFGTLRTAVLFAQGTRGPTRTLLVTSARPGEGKTTIAVNLALSLARLGGRVLLVDADTRRPTAHHAFGLAQGLGLGEYLRDAVDWPTLVRRDVAPGLDLLPAGGPLRGPTELLSTARPAALLEEGRQRYDFVVVDAPALLINAADTRILSPLVDGVVMVVRSGATPRPLVESLIRQVPNVVGVVLNDVAPRHFPSYYPSRTEAPELVAAT